jgi:outer membrane immunogenic protein
MKQLLIYATALSASCGLALTTFAGSDYSSGKSMKQVAPAPLPECEWTGFYLGLNAGGQFGHSETKDLDNYWYPQRPWGYSESSAVGGGQIGYNYQWHWLVLGPELDFGYMDVDGHHAEPGTNFPGGQNFGSTSSDFYTTWRGRIGVNLDWQGCWLIYGTGGGIGLNYETRDYDPNENFLARRENFKVGYTVGGGIERKIGTRWSIKAEYLYFDVDSDNFSTVWTVANGGTGLTYRFNGDTAGHIIRGGLNFHF